MGIMNRQENAPRLVVVFEDGQPVEVTTGLPLAGFNPKYAVETYVPTPLFNKCVEALKLAAEHHQGAHSEVGKAIREALTLASPSEGAGK